MQQGLNIPAGHESILGGDSDNSGAFVGILAVSCQPGDGLGMIPSDVLDGHRVLGIKILAIQNLERSVVERHAYLTVRINTNLHHK